MVGSSLSEEARKKVSRANMGHENARGEKNGFSKLTEKGVLRIRRCYDEELENRKADGRQKASDGFATKLAEYYGVTATCISQIGLRRTWTHLPESRTGLHRRKK